MSAARVLVCDDEAQNITGQVFVVYGATVKRMQMWSPMAEIVSDQPWTDDEFDRFDRMQSDYRTIQMGHWQKDRGSFAAP